jgi:hypothetical protein
MRELEIQKLLRSQADALTQLKQMGIDWFVHPHYDNLIQFTYNMIDCMPNKDHVWVREARGLMLDRDRNWAVVAEPMHRFFNWGETGCAAVDWTTARVQEKLDGSLLILCNHSGQWIVSTKKNPGGHCAVGDWPVTFCELFWEIFNQQHPNGREQLVPGWTYCWELTSEKNRVITHIRERAVTLLAVRDEQGCEMTLDDARLWVGWKRVQQFDISSAAAAQQAAELLDPLQQEGFVVVDAQFRRAKIKSARYVQLHHVRFGLNLKDMLDLIRQGEHEEALTYFPELQDRFDSVVTAVNQFVAEVEQRFEPLREQYAGQVIQGEDRAAVSASRKQYAEAVKSSVPSHMQGAMFVMINGNCTARHWLMSQTNDCIIRTLGLKNKQTANLGEV